MTFEQYKVIADKMRPFAKVVYLILWGEPLLNGDIFKIISYTASFARPDISTNGMLINESNARQLIESSPRSIIVSIDGTTQDVYEQYRVGGSVSQAFRSLELLAGENRRQGSDVRIIPQFIVFKHNQHQVDEFAALCSSIGLEPSFKSPYFLPGSPYSNSDFPQYTRTRFPDEAARREAMRVCPDPQTVMNIFLDGSVVPCCHALETDLNFGNIFKEELLDIWNSPAYRKFSAEHVQGNLSDFCLDHCLEYIGPDVPEEELPMPEIAPPFMNPHEIAALEIALDYFKGPLSALEWGSGNSSMYFSARLAKGSSWSAYEHDQSWYQEVASRLKAIRKSTATVKLVQPDKQFDGLTDGDFATFRSYVLAPTKTGKKFDFILVDGRSRIECMAIGWDLLDDHGVMVLHDAQRREYDPGIPKNGYWVRMINPAVIVEEPIAVLFMAKEREVIAALKQMLRQSLPGSIEVISNIDQAQSGQAADHAGKGSAMTWAALLSRDKKYLYAGDVPDRKEYADWVGLSLTQSDAVHLNHDITLPYPLPDNCADRFQAEDVLEHIPYEQLIAAFDEIHRILKPGGLFRLSVPDYRCDVLRDRSVKNSAGDIVFDPQGGGTPENPGHVWFPSIELVTDLVCNSAFGRQGTAEYLHFHNSDGSYVTKPVDYSKGHVDRTPDHDERVRSPYRPMSIIVDLVKGGNPAGEKRPADAGDSRRQSGTAQASAQAPAHASAQVSVEPKGSCTFVNTYYQGFLNSMYAKVTDLNCASYEDQINTLQAQYFGDSDFYSGWLIKAGWNADDLIVNCDAAQQAWARQRGLSGSNLAVMVEQIKRARPEVIYLQNLGLATPEFFAAVRPYTKLIVGQIAYPLSAETEVAGFDIIISSFPHFVDRFRAAGITSYYQPLAFDSRVLESITRFDYDKRPVECSFVGGISPMHGKGYLLLETLAANLPIGFWGYGAETLPAGSAIASRHHGEIWGRDMFYMLGASKITINRHIDVAENYANNMRLFEATGCGALLITDYKENLNELFEIGKEVVVYHSPEECIELVRYYLSHPDEARKIAQAGQARTLREHSYQKRMEQTAAILSRHLRLRQEQDTLVMPARVSDAYRKLAQDQVTPELESAWKNPGIPLQQRALVHQQLREMYCGSVAQPFGVLADLLLPLAKEPLSVLEIGCSSGYYYEVLEYLLKSRISYTGVDYSDSMIELAKSYYPEARFVTADGANLPLPDAAFKVVVSGSVLLHVSNYPRHIAETARVAQKYVVIHRTPVCRTAPTSCSSKHAYGVETVEFRFNEQELLGHFEQHGFKLVRTLVYHEDARADQYEASYLLERIRPVVQQRPASPAPSASPAPAIPPRPKGPVVLVSRAIAFTFPLSYAYLAGELRAQGEDVRVLFKEVPASTLVRQIMDLNPVLLGLGNLYPELEETRQLIRLLDLAGRRFPIVIGGQMVSPTPEFAVRVTGADFGVIGEGELILAELVKRLRSGADVSDLKGLVVREGNRIVSNGPGAFIEDLSKGLPAIPYDLFPTDQWLPIGAWYAKNYPQPHWKLEDRVINVHGGRGCPYTCNFCYHHSKPRYREIPAMMEEAQEALIRFDGNMLYFSDDLVMANPKRARQLIEAIGKLDRPVSFSISTRFDILARMDDQLLLDLKKAGCRNMGLGLESGSDRILKLIGKNCSAQQIEEGLDRLRRVGIYPSTSIMLGQYTETMEDAALSIALMQRTVRRDPYLNYAFTLTTPFPGSELYNLIFQKGILKDDQEFYDRYFSSDGEFKQVVNLSGMSDAEVGSCFEKIHQVYGVEKRVNNAILGIA